MADADVRLLAAVHRLHESNPTLGLRGVRLGLTLPALSAVRIRALAEATAERLRAGGDPGPEVMVPLVRSVAELRLVRDEATRPLAEVSAAEGVPLDLPLGTMIELPRAALTAHRIAEVADFVSFGTNDLTQTTWGLSRDDVEAGSFAAYLDNGVSPSCRSTASTGTASDGRSRWPPPRDAPSPISRSACTADTSDDPDIQRAGTAVG